MNVWSFTGRLTRDCEQRFTQGGKAICSFAVAVDFGFGEKKGTNFPRCALFGARAEGGLPQYLTKGAQVAISGELKIAEYDDKDGNKRTSVDVSVDKLDLIGGKQESEAQRQSAGANSPSGNMGEQQPDFSQTPVDSDIPF